MGRTLNPKHDLEAEFAFIRDYISQHLFPPTDKEVALHFRMSASTVYYHRIIMRRRGWLTWRKHYLRTMKVTRQ